MIHILTHIRGTRLVRVLFVLFLTLGATSVPAQDKPGETPVSAGESPAGATAPSEPSAANTPVQTAPAVQAAPTAQVPEPAAEPLSPDDPLVIASQRIEQVRTRLAGLREQVEKNEADDRILADIKIQTDALVREVLSISVDLRPRLNDIQTRLTELGEPPAEGQPAENAAVTQERNRLNASRSEINAMTGQAEDLSIEAKTLSDRISNIRRSLFTNQLFAHTEIDGTILRDAWDSFRSDAERVRKSILSWLQFVVRFKAAPLAIAVVLSLALASAIVFAEYRLFGRLHRRDPTNDDPSYISRLSVAFWSTILPSLALTFFLVSTYFLLQTFNVLRGDIAPIAASVFALIGLVFFVTAVSRAVLAPAAPNWRLVHVSNRGARDLSIAIFLMVLVNGVDFVLAVISETYSSPVVLTVVKSLVSSVIVGLLLVLVSLLKPVLSESENPAAPGRDWPRTVSYTLRGVGVVLILAASIGYVGLARFLATQIVVTGAVVATIYIGILSGKAISAPNQFGETRVGRFIGRQFRLSSVGLDQSGIVAGLFIYAFALATGVPLILMSWGFQPGDIRLWVYRLFTEINVGTIRISIFGILGGILLFAIGLVLTRWFQKWLDGNVMARSQVDGGVRNSVRTGIGYLGTGLAGIVGISAAGIDLSSLALVAGALSLGIGFGLQNIVSNFVSGLILLVERPFKVGDHVITGVNEGIVQRISVRATEIETFRRQTIIVPNSELINAPVGNWTHRNRVQRSEVPVSVAFDSDPEEIIQVLLEVVADNPDILRNPEPHVEFLRFGASSLDFELRFHLADMGKGLDIRNNVRVEILKRFRARGIVMPYPHQDVTISMRDAMSITRRGRKPLAPQKSPDVDLQDEPDDDKILP
ncbi:DUF3772 domain-containing protein [Rhizobium sp. G187]|uniref:DUF3772 domain-containing protein n=1 Tax=Rhizobium sp. G187 TaxID=3451352 RepID=UPI003EE747EE